MIKWSSFYKRIPNQIKIGKKVYQILWSDTFPDGRYGETDFEKKIIALDLNQSEKNAVHTYAHEIIHALSDENDIGLTEKQVTKLEKCLKDVLKPGNIFK